MASKAALAASNAGVDVISEFRLVPELNNAIELMPATKQIELVALISLAIHRSIEGSVREADRAAEREEALRQRLHEFLSSRNWLAPADEHSNADLVSALNLAVNALTNHQIQVNQLLDDIDTGLSILEDTVKGHNGDEITRLRGLYHAYLSGRT